MLATHITWAEKQYGPNLTPGRAALAPCLVQYELLKAQLYSRAKHSGNGRRTVVSRAPFQVQACPSTVEARVLTSAQESGEVIGEANVANTRPATGTGRSTHQSIAPSPSRSSS